MPTPAPVPPPADIRRLHLWQIQALRDAMVIAAVVGLVWLGYAMRSVTVPLLVALMLAYLFEPLIVWACKRYNARRPVIVAGLVLSIIVTIVLVIAIAVPLIVGQTMQMVRDLRSHRLEYSLISLRQKVPEVWIEQYDAAAESLTDLMGARYRPPMPRTSEAAVAPSTTQADGAAATSPVEGEPADGAAPADAIALTDLEIRELVRTEVERQLAQRDALLAATAPAIDPAAHTPGLGAGAASSIWRISRSTVGAIAGFLGQVLKIGFLFFLIPFYLFFFSLWYPQIVAFVGELIPRDRAPRAVELLGKMDRVIAGFVRGRIVISIIIGIICAVGWTLCGVPYAIVLGLMTGIFSAVPYLGFVGLPIAVLMLWVNQLGEPPNLRMSWLAIIGWPTLVYVVMQILETYIITPTIAGKATNLDPVTILVAVLAGGSVGGVYGMLLAIPTAACLKILLTDVLMPRVRLWVKGRAEDPLPL
jgi:predicted PurR-regulated permease PerM